MSFNSLVFSFAFLVAAFQNQAISKPPPLLIQCNSDLLRTYMLKGFDKASDTKKFHMCSGVIQNCCTVFDQKRIYHYVNDVLPNRITQHKVRMTNLWLKLKKLHFKIKKSEYEIKGSKKKKAFCKRRFRKFSNFSFEPLDHLFEEWYDDFEHRNLEFFSRFYCILCDGENQKFFKTPADDTHSFTVDLPQCVEFVGNNKESILLWSIYLHKYLRMMQDIVDCTHYVKSYKLPFYDSRLDSLSNDARKCLRASKDQKVSSCSKICERFSISNIMSFIDGNPVFLMNTLNFFERFFKNRETGNFISMKIRSFYKKFEALKTLSPIQENDFSEMILKLSEPKVSAFDPKKTFNVALGGRKLRQSVAAEGNSSDLFSVQERPSLNKNRRLLKAEKKEKIVTPKIETDKLLYEIYENLIVNLDTDVNRGFIFRPAKNLCNLDRAQRVLNEKVGIKVSKYEKVFFGMSEKLLKERLFDHIPQDLFLPGVQQILEHFNNNFVTQMDECLKTDYSITTEQMAEEGKRKEFSRVQKKNKKKSKKGVTTAVPKKKN